MFDTKLNFLSSNLNVIANPTRINDQRIMMSRFLLRRLIIAKDARALADRTYEYRNEPVDLHGDAFARVESQPSRTSARAHYSYHRRHPSSIVKQDVP